MVQRRKPAAMIVAWAGAWLVGLGGASASADSVVPVIGWMRLGSSGGGDSFNVFNGGTSSPTFGTGSAGSINPMTVFASTANQYLNLGDEITLAGQLQINRANLTPGQSIPQGNFSFGLWKKANTNAAAAAAAGWLGYMARPASNSFSGSPILGSLHVRNPDPSGFRTQSFPFANNFNATVAGPPPRCKTGQFCDPNPLTTDGVNVDYLADKSLPSSGSYFSLALAGANNNTNLQYNQLYNFSLHVGRYGSGDSQVDTTLTQVTLYGDYNDNGTVDAADYTVWRDHLGSSYSLPNRDPSASGNVGTNDYSIWKSNFGQQRYSWTVGASDYDGLIPVNSVGGNSWFTSHVVFDFDRIGMVFNGGIAADSANLANVQLSTDTIQTLTLQVNTTTGAANIKNALLTPLAIDYYEISSDKGELDKTSWTGIDGTAMTAPDGNGWDAAGGSDNKFLAEGNLTGSLTLAPNATSPTLGNIFNRATFVENRDLRFYIGLTDGSVIRGNVSYSASTPGAGAGVPEPSAWAMLLFGAMASGAYSCVARRGQNPLGSFFLGGFANDS
jgi:hypothetical protein